MTNRKNKIDLAMNQSDETSVAVDQDVGDLSNTNALKGS